MVEISAGDQRILPEPRGAPAPYGSATMLGGTRIPPGSMVASRPLDIQQDKVKTFGFNLDKVGSIFIDIRFRDDGTWQKYFDGTSPGGPGSLRSASFEEAAQQARVRTLMQAGGTADVFFGRFGEYAGGL